MKLVSKGFPEKDVTVFFVWGVRAMKKPDLMKSIPDRTKEQAALILANMYQVDEVGGKSSTRPSPFSAATCLLRQSDVLRRNLPWQRPQED